MLARAERMRVFKRLREFARAIEDERRGACSSYRSSPLSRSRKLFAPLAFAVGALRSCFCTECPLLLSNWRLTLVQILPAMWIWLAMYDLKAHVLKGRSLYVIRGPVLIPVVLAIMGITIAAFFLNAVFAYAITDPPPPEVRPALRSARDRLKPWSPPAPSWGRCSPSRPRS